MCTSLSYQTTTGVNFLARTMDFGFILNGVPIAIPRKFAQNFEFAPDETSRYGFIGTGKKVGNYFFADGLNEKGLAIAELYFPGEAKYSEKPVTNKLNLAPHEVISWILGEISSIKELKERISEINIVAAKNPLIGVVLPLHFIVSDESGETVVIEPMSEDLVVKNNPVNVMTNSPELEWHLKNLSNYLFLNPVNFEKRPYGELTVAPFGQGSGTLGLPGGYTGPERFIRTVYLTQNIKPATTTEDGIIDILHILGNVTIPKGVNIKDDGMDDFTQYKSILNTTEKTYYLNVYETNPIFSVKLTEDLLSAKEPTEFDLNKEVVLTSLN